MMPVLPSAQRVGRTLTILVASSLALAASRTAWAGDHAHTSHAPQPLPAQPENLYSRLDHDALTAELARHRFSGHDWPGHLERITRGLLDATYLLSALGEGDGVDKDPRFRLNAFDCTTFVETALALGHGRRYRDLPTLLDTIRYTGGRPHFQLRRHLITSQWIPELAAAGFVRDITTSVGREKTRFVHLHLTERRWARRRVARTLPLRSSRIPYGHYDVPYLPIKLALARHRSIPAGVIVNVVRANNPASPEVVTHQGLLVARADTDTKMVRHASPVAKRVIDEPLPHMLRRYLKARKWPILGINLLRVVPPNARNSIAARRPTYR